MAQHSKMVKRKGATDYQVAGSAHERMSAMLQKFIAMENGAKIQIIQGSGVSENGTVVPAMGLIFNDDNEPFGLTLEEADHMIGRLKQMQEDMPDLYGRFGGASLLHGLSLAAEHLRKTVDTYNQANDMGVVNGNLGKTIQ